MRDVHLAGYTGKIPELLFAAAEQLDATVLDIRLSPRSRNPAWSKSRLQTLLGSRYEHVAAFGNVAYRTGGPTQLADPEAGLALVEPDQWSARFALHMSPHRGLSSAGRCCSADGRTSRDRCRASVARAWGLFQNRNLVGGTSMSQRVVIYCRVSSAGQEDNTSLDTQEAPAEHGHRNAA